MMPMKVAARGFAELDKLLNDTLPLAVRKEVLQAAIHVAARPMVQEARSRYKVGGSDSLALATRTWNVRRGQRARYGAVVHLGPKRDHVTALSRYYRHYYPNRPVPQRAAAYGIRHAHLVEFGTGLRRSKYGKEWNAAPAQRVLGRTVEGNATTYVGRFRDILGRQIRKSIRRGRSRT